MTNSSSNPNIKKLESFFRHRLTARLDELQRALDVSGRTVFRVLGQVGYLSSYSHAGKYYTLAQIPSFDVDGLWAHAGILFSSHGTLRNTIVHMINKAAGGHTHSELQDRLRLRVYDTLHDLVAAREIARADIERLYLYVSAERERADAQIAERQRLIAQLSRPGPLPDAAVVIEVLLAVIHSPKPNVETVAAFLLAQGKTITREQVEAVWAHYELVKKTPASRRSRR
jgi:hypothetical protein